MKLGFTYIKNMWKILISSLYGNTVFTWVNDIEAEREKERKRRGIFVLYNVIGSSTLNIFSRGNSWY